MICLVSVTASAMPSDWHATAMPRIDFSSPEFHYDATDPKGFRNGMLRFGTRVGDDR